MLRESDIKLYMFIILIIWKNLTQIGMGLFAENYHETGRRQNVSGDMSKCVLSTCQVKSCMAISIDHTITQCPSGKQYQTQS